MNNQTKFILPETRDALHSFLIDKVRLNRYDQKFMINIKTKYILDGRPLSTNQNELYEKIVHKYRKQLKKLGVNWRDIKELPWKNGIVDIAKLTQHTYFKLVQDSEGDVEMRMYFNFNKKHIEEIRSFIHDDAGQHFNVGADNNFGNRVKYDFVWDKNNKVWLGPFNLYLFKSLYEFACDKKLQIDSTVQELVDRLDACGSKAEWTPSVRIVHGRLYVNHIAEEMLPILDNIDPTDLSVRNIERMTKLGLAAPASMDSIAEYVEGSSPLKAHDIQSEYDIAQLKEYIARSGRKCLFHETPVYGKNNNALTKSMIRTWDGVAVVDDQPDDKFIEKGYDTLITTMPHTRLIRSQDSVGKFALEADKIIHITIKNANSNDTNK